MKRIALVAVCIAWAWTSAVAGESAVPVEGKKAEAAAAKATPGEDPTVAEVHKKLEKKVSFEFVDTPLGEAVIFLSTFTKVKMTFDPQTTKAERSLSPCASRT